MAALVAVLLTLTPFAIYLVWRRYGPRSGEPSSAMILSLLLGIGLMLGAAVWFGLSRSIDTDAAYVPATLGPDGTIRPGHQESRP